MLMLHGFPELWYSYRHQIPALADAGYHAVAPDVRGYGQSDAPPRHRRLRHEATTSPTRSASSTRSAKRPAVVVGHDWGAPMAWNSAALHPDRYRAVIGMSVPFLPRVARAADCSCSSDLPGQLLLYAVLPGARRRREGVRS